MVSSTTSDEIVVLANDVVPGMGMPVAAPGLRAWGIAVGLRALGHRVTVAVNRRIADRAMERAIPPSRPPGTILMSPTQVGDYVRVRGCRALVLTNSNHFDAVAERGGCPIVYDFFAPKTLEMAEQEHAGSPALQRLEARKLRALAGCQAVIVNGAKKLDYVREWLDRAGRDPGSVPVRVVNPPVPLVEGEPPAEGPLQAVASGYVQPWSLPGSWTKAVRPLLDEGRVTLHLLIGSHWGGARRKLPDAFQSLAEHPAVHHHGVMGFRTFRDFLSRCDVSIDLFERNAERELAMVTRTVVALSCGVPVLHVPFTEVGPMVDQHDAGWLLDPEDVPSIEQTLRNAAARGDDLAEKRAGVRRLGAELLDPPIAVQPLHELLGDL